jgi:hypothetical protein
MLVATEEYAAWLAQADIPDARRTPQLDALLQAVFRFRQQQGSDYYSTRLLSHFLLHSDTGLKVAQIARLLGIARPTASKQQGLSSKAAIQQAQHRMAGRSHGKLLPRYAGPIAAFLVGHPKASQTELIGFVADTFGVQVSRIALYKYLKKYGLHKVANPAQSPASAEAGVTPSATSDGGSGGVAVEKKAPAQAGVDPSATPPEASPIATVSAATMAPSPARALVPVNAATPIAAPAPVIELARAIEPSKPSAPPFSSGGRNTPAPLC